MSIRSGLPYPVPARRELIQPIGARTGSDEKIFQAIERGLTGGGPLIIWPSTGEAHGHSGQRLPVESLKSFRKIAVDGRKSPPYMAVHRRGRAIWLWSRSRLIDRYFRCPRIKTGRVRRRLFDIVGLDEGTCGRRPRHSRVLRPREVGKLCRSYMSSYISTVICICAGTAP